MLQFREVTLQDGIRHVFPGLHRVDPMFLIRVVAEENKCFPVVQGQRRFRYQLVAVFARDGATTNSRNAARNIVHAPLLFRPAHHRCTTTTLYVCEKSLIAPPLAQRPRIRNTHQDTKTRVGKIDKQVLAIDREAARQQLCDRETLPGDTNTNPPMPPCAPNAR